MQDMLVVRIEFILIVEEAELCIVFLFGLHHYLHLNAVLGNEHCCTFYYCMHLLCMRLQHRAVIVSKYSKGNQLITIIYRTLSSTLHCVLTTVLWLFPGSHCLVRSSGCLQENF